MVLNRFFPATATTATSGVAGANKLSTEEMRNCLQASAARLVAHFVEVQGAELARISKSGLDVACDGTGDVVTQATWGRTLIMRLDGLVREIGNALGTSARRSCWHRSMQEACVGSGLTLAWIRWADRQVCRREG